MTKHPKRPRDLNQWAKRMVDLATGDTSDREPTPADRGVWPTTARRGFRLLRRSHPPSGKRVALRAIGAAFARPPL